MEKRLSGGQMKVGEAMQGQSKGRHERDWADLQLAADRPTKQRETGSDRNRDKTCERHLRKSFLPCFLRYFLEISWKESHHLQ